MTIVRERPSLLDPHPGPGPGSSRARTSARRRLVRAFLAVDVLLATLVMIMFVAVYVVESPSDDRGNRLDDDLDGLTDRATPVARAGRDAVNVLLVGTDRDPAGTQTARRGDTVVVLRLASDRRAASVIPVPPSAWAPGPGGASRPAATVQAAEEATGVRIHHVEVMHRAGLRALVAAVRGRDDQGVEDRRLPLAP